MQSFDNNFRLAACKYQVRYPRIFSWVTANCISLATDVLR